MLLLYPVALERVRLVGITVGLTLTSSVTDLNKKTISRYSCLEGHGKKGQFNRIPRRGKAS